MAQLNPCLHSTFKELSNDTSYAQIQVKTKKLWSQKIEEKKVYCDAGVCRDKLQSLSSLSQQTIFFFNFQGHNFFFLTPI